MELSSVTPVILTYNEEANIARVLERLPWASRIVLVDSGSTDRTQDIARRFRNVVVVERKFDDHVTQWNFGLAQVDTSWVLSLDADYVLSDTFARELEQLEATANGYEAHFRYCVGGRALAASLYPPRLVLFRRDKAVYISDGHTQILQLDGAPGRLNSPIYHDDRKPLQSWLWAQDRYSRLELTKLLTSGPEHLSFADRLRLKGWAAPLVVPLYCLFGKGLIRDGWSGLFYTLQRTYAEVLLALRLLEHRLGQSLARKEHADAPSRATEAVTKELGPSISEAKQDRR